jgi:hypothetical protein
MMRFLTVALLIAAMGLSVGCDSKSKGSEAMKGATTQPPAGGPANTGSGGATAPPAELPPPPPMPGK